MTEVNIGFFENLSKAKYGRNYYYFNNYFLNYSCRKKE